MKLLRHCQKETLSDVIVTYFRVVKQATEKRQLLAPVLEGLAKYVRLDSFAFANLACPLPPALPSLGACCCGPRFAHLVNLDTIEDLLAELKLILETSLEAQATLATGSETGAGTGPMVLPLEAAFNCVRTAQRTLNGPGRELGVEDSTFTLCLFKLLPGLADEHGRSHYQCLALAVECLEAVLLKRRE